MKLKLINDSTGTDENGRPWFKSRIEKPHAYWLTCSECGKRSNECWECWPSISKIVCNNCVNKEKE